MNEEEFLRRVGNTIVDARISGTRMFVTGLTGALEEFTGDEVLTLKQVSKFLEGSLRDFELIELRGKK